MRDGKRNGYSLLEVMFTVGIVVVVTAIAVPMGANLLGDFRLSGDARGVTNAISLAKMRASATFTQARLYVDLSTSSFRVETWDKTGASWKSELGSMYLNSRDSFGFGAVGTSPPNTQTTIGQPAPCLDNTAHSIGNTACVLFNSRGIPIDSTGAPTGANAVYLTDGTFVYGAAVSATGMIRLWRTPPKSAPTWNLQ
jgi:Tfp pilus assembly protein FimT